MASGNRADRRKAAKANGVHGQLFSQLVVLNDIEGMTYGQVAGAIVAGLEGIVSQGAAPLERCAITMGTDHPEHPGALVIEVKTDRKAIVPVNRVMLGEALDFGPTDDRAPMFGGKDEDGL